MASLAVYTAVKERLGSSWNELAVRYPNDGQGETPADGSAYIAVQFPVANTDRMAVNQRLYREEGGIRLVVHAERGDGLDQVLGWTGALAALFSDQAFGGIKTQAAGSPFIDDDNELGNYFKAAVVIPYTFTHGA